MNKRIKAEHGLASRILCLLALLPAAVLAQVPVDENGDIIGNYEPQAGAAGTGNEDIPLLSSTELEDLVGPVAVYPDDGDSAETLLQRAKDNLSADESYRAPSGEDHEPNVNHPAGR